jgi:hypothetical protein
MLASDTRGRPRSVPELPQPLYARFLPLGIALGATLYVERGGKRLLT